MNDHKNLAIVGADQHPFTLRCINSQFGKCVSYLFSASFVFQCQKGRDKPLWWAILASKAREMGGAQQGLC